MCWLLQHQLVGRVKNKKKFVKSEICWFYTDFCKTWVCKQILGTVPGEEEGEETAHIGSLCTLRFSDLHVTSVMIFDYGKKKEEGAYKEGGQKHACHSFVQFQSLADVPWTSHCLCPPRTAQPSRRDCRQKCAARAQFCTIYLILSRLWGYSLSQANLKKIHSWEWNPGSAVSNLMLILV